MKNAKPLISAIEAYKKENHKYPNQLENLKPIQLTKIPRPNIMGISCYKYENKNANYNLYFTQNVFFFGFNFEVVVYDPKNLHTAEGELKTLYKTEVPNWKYYIYD